MDGSRKGDILCELTQTHKEKAAWSLSSVVLNSFCSFSQAYSLSL